MNWIWPILIQALAFGVFVMELIIPSFGLLAIACLGLFVYSWSMILSDLPRTAVLIFGIADLILVPLGIWLAIKNMGRSPLSHRSNLGTGSGLEGADANLAALIGQVGMVVATLRPTGKVEVAGETYEAFSEGEFLDPKTSVRILSANGTRLKVERMIG